MESKAFPCSQEGMVACQAFLESYCDSPKPAIVLDEVVSNIVRCSGASSFSLGLEQGDGGLVMVFEDAGKAFDPLTEAPLPNISAGIAERALGGLGIFMVKKMAKSVSYRREGGRNVLRVLM